METTEKKWYQTKKWIWILSFLFAPVGLYQLWRSQEFAKRSKILITFLVVVFYAIGMAMPEPEHKGTHYNPKDDYKILVDAYLKYHYLKDPDSYESENWGELIQNQNGTFSVSIHIKQRIALEQFQKRQRHL